MEWAVNSSVRFTWADKERRGGWLSLILRFPKRQRLLKCSLAYLLSPLPFSHVPFSGFTWSTLFLSLISSTSFLRLICNHSFHNSIVGWSSFHFLLVQGLIFFFFYSGQKPSLFCNDFLKSRVFEKDIFFFIDFPINQINSKPNQAELQLNKQDFIFFFNLFFFIFFPPSFLLYFLYLTFF